MPPMFFTGGTLILNSAVPCADFVCMDLVFVEPVGSNNLGFRKNRYPSLPSVCKSPMKDSLCPENGNVPIGTGMPTILVSAVFHPLQARIGRLAFHSKNGKGAFVNTPERLLLDKTFERFKP